MSKGYNSASVDASLSRIFEKLEAQDRDRKDMRAEMRKGFETIGNRVTVLEQEKWANRGALATIAVLAPLAWEWVKSKMGS